MAKSLSYDDLLAMTHGDLLTLQANVTKAFAETKSKNRKSAIDELKARARELGFDASDLFGKAGSTGAAKTKTPSPAKFANPRMSWKLGRAGGANLLGSLRIWTQASRWTILPSRVPEP